MGLKGAQGKEQRASHVRDERSFILNSRSWRERMIASRKETDEGDEKESQKKKKCVHTDQTKGVVRDGSWKG